MDKVLHNSSGRKTISFWDARKRESQTNLEEEPSKEEVWNRGP